MAGESVVGALRVVLGMDTASFEDGSKRASKSVADFGSHMKSVFAGVGLERIVERTFDLIAHTFKETIVHAFKFADEMGKMAQKVGVSVEELTGLKLAADLSDVSMETLSKSLGILSKNMVEAAGGNEELKRQFDALGISVRDNVTGEIKSVTQVLTEIADKFHNTEDGATKVAAALKLLGRGGKDLIPLLNEGGGSLREFAAVAERMGLVISRNTANQTQQFNDNLKILKLSLEGVGNLVVKELIPGFLRMSDHMAGTAKQGDLIKASAKAIADGFKQIVFQGILAIETIRLIGEVLAVVANSAKIGAQEIKTATGNFLEPMTKTVKGWNDQAVKMVEGVDLVKAGLRSALVAAEPLPEEFGGIADAVTNKMPAANAELLKIGPILERLKNLAPDVAKLVAKIFEDGAAAAKHSTQDLDAPNKNMDQFRDRLKALRADTLDAGGVFGGQLAQGFLSAAAGLKILEGQVINVHGRLLLLGPEAQQLNQAMLALQGARLTADFITPFEQFEQKLLALNALTEKYPELAGRAALAGKKAAFELAASFGETAASIVGPLASAFKTLAEQNKKFAGAAKALAIAEALVNTYLAATKALASGVPPFNYIAAAAVTAAGLANVAKISATQFATGGSFKVGGGLGGIDNQMITFKAQPGEMVDIRRPGQDRGAGSTVNLTLPARGSVATDDVRSLIETINGAIRDGYRINLAAT